MSVNGDVSEQVVRLSVGVAAGVGVMTNSVLPATGVSRGSAPVRRK